MALTVSWVHRAVRMNMLWVQVSGLRNTKLPSGTPFLEVIVTGGPGCGMLSRGFVLPPQVELKEAE